MKVRHLSLAVFSVLACFFALYFDQVLNPAAGQTTPSGVPTYRVTDLGVINTTFGQRISKPAGINNAGQVTGYSYSGTEAHAVRFSSGAIDDLGTIPGGSRSTGFGINDLGHVAGESEYSVNGGAIRHATLWDGAAPIDLGYLPGWGNYSRANGINDAGQVVGHSGASLSTSNTRAFIWDQVRGMRDMGTNGGGYAKAFSINDSGVATGTSQIGVGLGSFQAFIWDEAGGMRNIGTIGGSTSSGNFINNNGHITGSSTIAEDNRNHAFLWDGEMHDLGAIGSNDFLSDRSVGNGINIHDQVVGSTYRPYEGGALYQIAFVHTGGQMYDLETLVDGSGADYRLYSATGINDAGQIAVDAIQLSSGEIHAVLLTPNEGPTPTPTPTSTPVATPTACATPSTFSNTNLISIPGAGTSGIAAPYPAAITVSGVNGNISKVTVKLNSITHTFPDDIDMLLVAPGGQSATIMSDAGGPPDIANVTLTLDDSAGTSLPDASTLVSGTYRPSNFEGGDPFPSPAPAASAASPLAVFNGTDPNGTWSLYVVDDQGTDVGRIAGGWELAISTGGCVPTPTPTATPTASPTASGTPTATLTPTATPTGTPGPTPVPLPPGSLDPSFGNGGTVETAVGTEDRANALVLQPDGKIVVVGRTRPGPVRFDVAVARYNPDGTLDTGFGSGGTVLTSLIAAGGSDDEGYAVALQADGKIVVTGSARGSSGALVGTGIVRYNPNGSLDQSFGSGGLVFVERSIYAAVAIQADGKILCAGGGSFISSPVTDFRISRFNPDGSPDTTWGTGGDLAVDFAGDSDAAWALVIQPDNKIVAAGRSSNPGDDDNYAAIRLNIDGTLDQSFGSGGKVVVDFAGMTDYGFGVALQADGKIIISGRALVAVNNYDFGLVRLNSNGTIDATFGNNGRVSTDFVNGTDTAWAVKVQTNGKIVAAGVSGGSATAFGIARYNTDGTLDPTFGNGGIVETFFESQDEARGVQIQPDGKIVAAGVARGGGILGRFAVARYFGDPVAQVPSQRTRFDFDGDGRADLGVYRSGTWYLDRSRDGGIVEQFGLPADTITPADFDGDGKTDLAVYRDGVWYINRSSSGTVVVENFGLASDLPQAGDYDGDGSAELAVFRPSNGTWYVKQGSGYSATQFGIASDRVVAADRDGDGKTDISVFRPATGEWYWISSQTMQPVVAHFGTDGDIPVTGDFDGDGKCELAVFRPSNGTWYLAGPRGVPDQNFTAVQFGLAADRPVPADYDGDGKTDLAVYRDGLWYVQRSGSGLMVQQFGLTADRPVPMY